MNKKRLISAAYYALLFLALFVSCVGGALLIWYKETFGVRLEEILFAVKYPLKGADTDFLKAAIIAGIIGAAFMTVFFVAAVGVRRMRKKISARSCKPFAAS